MINNKVKTAIDILPLYIKNLTESLAEEIKEAIEEIRIRAETPVLIYLRNREIVLCDEKGKAVTAEKRDLEEVINNITKNSLYAYLDDIKRGFITIEGGHRIGVCGTAVTENGAIINIRDIMSINIRIAREIKGVSNELMSDIIKNGKIRNTLIISPPQAGKTTLIRDIARNLSKLKMTKIVIIDERDEIAAVYRGIPQNDVGQRSFVLSGYSKKDGFLHGIRSLSPTVIICDELGDKNDSETVKNAVNKGVKVIATIHGYSKEDISGKKDLRELLDFFECIIEFINGEFVVKGV